MAFRVVKIIHGIPYIYEQSSVRVGKKVHSKCRCLGRAGGGSLTKGICDIREQLRKIPENPPEKHEQVIKKILKKPTKPRRLPKKAEILTLQNKLKNSVDLGKFRISTKSLEKEHENAFKFMQKAGLDPREAPEIAIKHGSTVTHKKRWNDCNYSVTIPKAGKNLRSRFKDHFSKVIARSTLDLLAKRKPEQFSKLMFDFDKSFKETQKALFSYMKAASPKGFFRACAVYYFGIIGKASQRFLPVPERLGLVDFSKRKTPEDELVTLLSHVQKNGFSAVKKQYDRDFFLTGKSYRTALENWKKSSFPFNSEQRKELKKWEARMQGVREYKNKMETLRGVFGL